MSLFTQRQAAREEAAARARGESVDCLVDEAPKEFRQQLCYAINTAITWPLAQDWQRRNMLRYLAERIRRHLCEEYGKPCLVTGSVNEDEDLGQFILNEATTPQAMDVIDAVIKVLGEEALTPGARDCAVGATVGSADTVAKRMKQHKLAYDLVEFKVVEKRSKELHQAAVAPALTLLHGRTCFADAERQYRDALDELAAGNWADAVTDGNAAVENVLRAILSFTHGDLTDLLGCSGAGDFRRCWGGSPLPPGGNPPSRQPLGPAVPGPDARRYSRHAADGPARPKGGGRPPRASHPVAEQRSQSRALALLASLRRVAGSHARRWCRSSFVCREPGARVKDARQEQISVESHGGGRRSVSRPRAARALCPRPACQPPTNSSSKEFYRRRQKPAIKH